MSDDSLSCTRRLLIEDDESVFSLPGVGISELSLRNSEVDRVVVPDAGVGDDDAEQT